MTSSQPAPSTGSDARNIGLLGGTFDPPHVGHLIIAECARVALGLEEVRLLVAGDPWMKRTEASPQQRAAMVRCAVADGAGLVCDDREVRRDGPTYTVDTLRELRSEQPDVTWTFLLGEDAAASLPRWWQAPALAELASFVVVARRAAPVVEGDSVGVGHAGLDRELAALLGRSAQRLEVPTVGVSSSDMRERYRTGQATRHMVPAAVDDLVRQLGLYGCRDTGDATS